jgi:hypothetical protein
MAIALEHTGLNTQHANACEQGLLGDVHLCSAAGEDSGHHPHSPAYDDPEPAG